MPRLRWMLAAAFLSSAIILGGGGSPAPRSEMVLELLALTALVIRTWSSDDGRFVVQADRAMWAVLALVAAVPLLQLIPLPPAVWHALPGREVEVAALQLVGAEDGWRPLSVAPLRTLASLLSLIPPIATFVLIASLPMHERTDLIGIVALLGILTGVVGAVQLAGGDQNWARLYDFSHNGYITGFQANRNATADVLLITIVAAVVFVVESPRFRTVIQSRIVVGAAALLMALCVVLTGSRTGVALLLSAIVVMLVVFRPRRAMSRTLVAGLLVMGLASGAAVVALKDNAALDRTWARFEGGEDPRGQIWADTLYAIGQVWPAGAGVGTFVPMFIAGERLESVDTSRPNRAHNEYLETALEGGLPGVLMLAAAGGLILVRLSRLLRAHPEPTRIAHAIFAAATMGILMLHSLVDYPIRSMSLACVAAFALALIARSPRNAKQARRVWQTSLVGGVAVDDA